MEFSNYTVEELINVAPKLVGEECEQQARRLRFLIEVNKRKVYLTCGYGSLFSYCIFVMNHTRAEAHVRVLAVRLSRHLPNIPTQIEEGKITLSVAAEAQSFFQREKKEGRELSVEQKEEVVESLLELSFREAEVRLQERFNASPVKKKLMFYASPELVEKLEKLKDLLAHQNYDRDLATLVEILADKALAAIEKPTSRPRPAKSSVRTSQPKARTRYIPRNVRRQVWIKAHNRCEYVDVVSGRRCDSKHALEIDHIQPFSMGGGNEISNLRLLCASHNQFRNESVVSPETGRPEFVN